MLVKKKARRYCGCSRANLGSALKPQSGSQLNGLLEPVRMPRVTLGDIRGEESVHNTISEDSNMLLVLRLVSILPFVNAFLGIGTGRDDRFATKLGLLLSQNQQFFTLVSASQCPCKYLLALVRGSR